MTKEELLQQLTDISELLGCDIFFTDNEDYDCDKMQIAIDQVIEEKSPKYNIVRYYQNLPGHTTFKNSKVVRTGLSYEDAKEHCSSPLSEGTMITTIDGMVKHMKWFDGFTEMTETEQSKNDKLECFECGGSGTDVTYEDGGRTPVVKECIDCAGEGTVDKKRFI